MKRELSYFSVNGVFGGSQAWFSDIMMNRGGCGAVSACDICICLALNNGITGLYPYDIKNLTKKDYVNFGMEMKRFLSPRRRGIDTLDIFVGGFRDYLESIGETKISFSCIQGYEDYEKVPYAVKSGIDSGIPLAVLVLHHKNPDFSYFEWHWFLLVGYEERGGEMYVKAATYGNFRWLSLRALWDTGNEKKGGIVCPSIIK